MGAFEIAAFVALAAAFGSVLYSRARFGSWTGAFLGARIKRTVGTVGFRSSWSLRQTLQVHVMEKPSAGESFVGLTLISKAPLAIRLSPYRLTRAQALELAQLLEKAASACKTEVGR